MDYRRRKKIQLKTPEVISGEGGGGRGEETEKHSRSEGGAPRGGTEKGSRKWRNGRGIGNGRASVKCDRNAIWETGWTRENGIGHGGKVLIAPRLAGNTRRFSLASPAKLDTDVRLTEREAAVARTLTRCSYLSPSYVLRCDST